MSLERANEAFYKFECEIQQAVQQKISYQVDFYHCLRNSIETQELIKHLQQMNDPRLSAMINYLQQKFEFYEQAIKRYI